jgi:hypothetical protein
LRELPQFVEVHSGIDDGAAEAAVPQYLTDLGQPHAGANHLTGYGVAQPVWSTLLGRDNPDPGGN